MLVSQVSTQIRSPQNFPNKSRNLWIIKFTLKVMTGVIKRLTDRGFGFLAIEGEEKELFFHSSALVGTTYEELNEGDTLTFEVEESDKGPRAINVQRV